MKNSDSRYPYVKRKLKDFDSGPRYPYVKRKLKDFDSGPRYPYVKRKLKDFDSGPRYPYIKRKMRHFDSRLEAANKAGKKDWILFTPHLLTNRARRQVA